LSTTGEKEEGELNDHKKKKSNQPAGKRKNPPKAPLIFGEGGQNKEKNIFLVEKPMAGNGPR